MNMKALTSLLVLTGFAVSLGSGLVKLIMPAGRIAYWTGWSLWGLSKTDWDNLHVVSSVLWSIALLFHVYFNWNVLTAYIYRRARGGWQRRREIAAALAAGVLVAAVSLHPVPPVSNLLDAVEKVKESWAAAPGHEPPFGHAEQVSLRSFARRQNIDLKLALTELAKYGITVDDADRSLQSIAAANGVAPMAVYAAVEPLEKKTAVPAAGSDAWTPGMVEEAFAGRGLGKKDTAGAAEMIGMPEGELLTRLKAKGVDMQRGGSFKEIADEYGISALDLLKAVLIEDYELPES